MPTDADALAFLDSLERDELALLAWGLVEGYFSEEEVEERARVFFERCRAAGVEVSYASPVDLVEALRDDGLLWQLPQFASDSVRYRTRFGESVRLFAALRQIFNDPQRRAWRTAPRLVSDFRLVRSHRAFPRRHLRPSDVVGRLGREVALSPAQADVIGGLVGAGTGGELLLADFQVRAAARILSAGRARRQLATVVCAGTGSGKTLAFYLPAYLAIAETLDASEWTRCLAIYPRKELLKDQLREAIANARRISAPLARHNRRRLVLGALYADVPQSGSAVRWPSELYRGNAAYRCPYFECPTCGDRMIWRADDARNGVELLLCARRECEGRLEPDEIRLTRDRMFTSPPDVLFTTTEMLNQRLSAWRYRRLFGVGQEPRHQPRFVLIDEVHAYEGMHGAHVAYLLRRWRHRSGARPHFVGLSATLADAPRFFGDLVGVRAGDVAEVTPTSNELEYEGAEYQIALRGSATAGTTLLSTTIQAAMLLRRTIAPRPDNGHFGSRVFAFTDNLDALNRFYHNLLDAEGRDSFGRPLPRPLGSLANLRARTCPSAAERFRAGQNWALVEDVGHVLADGERARVARTSSQDPGVATDAEIVVATSALELGYDDPEVGAILQHKAPQTTSAFLQRKGRAGRRRSIRPWMVVVLSDWGRDRRAYQSHERLFSPAIEARRLPLENRAILKMQGTYTLLDWLGARIASSERPDPWLDLAGPVAGDPWGARRQAHYVEWLRRLLEDSDVRDNFAVYLGAALGVSQETSTALLWEAPRSLLMGAVPTLLRRLESNFGRAGGEASDLHTRGGPLPDFVPRALFGDLQLPEVAIRLPGYRGRDQRDELMPLAQALAEFAPGRVSRRFGLTDANERHWIHPGETDSIRVADFCPPSDRRDLGYFGFSEGGRGIRARVFRPHVLHVKLPSAGVRPTSNASLEWRTEILPSDEPYPVEGPAGSHWATIVRLLGFYTHHLGNPVEVRRFATGVRATVLRDGFPRVERRIAFHERTTAGTDERAGVGFAMDADAIEVRICYPALLYTLCTRDLRLLRGLRTARYRALVADSPALEGVANYFQREWLTQVYLSAVTIHALQTQSNLEEAEAAAFSGSAIISPRDVAATILQWDDNGSDGGGLGSPPARLQEIQALLGRGDVLEVLHDAARALVEDPDEAWEPWLRSRFKATLGAALAQAAFDVCPQTDSDALVVDTEGLSWTRESTGHSQLDDSLCLTEEAVGGGGVVEALLSAYAEDPRRFFNLVECALGPSDLETVADDLGRLVGSVASEEPNQTDLKGAFAALRGADSHGAQSTALVDLRARLSERGVPPTPTLLVALNSRVLGPGTDDRTDALLARVIARWDEAEQRLGIDVDSRAFAFVHSRDASLEAALGVVPEGGTEDARAAWRYGVLYSMLWPRGADLRLETLRASNPFARPIECDRLLVLAAVPSSRRSISLTQASWFDTISEVLARDGVAELTASVEETRSFVEALHTVAAEAVDAGGVLVHARLSAVYRDDKAWRAVLELPEAWQ